MPNIDAPKGLVPVRKLDGSPWNGLVQKFFVSTGDATAIYVGDLVKLTGSSGGAGATIAGENLEGVPIVARVTASNDAVSAWAGVVTGFKVNPDNLMQKHRAASTNRIVYVNTDPDTVYEVQEDATTTPIVAASVGLNANLAYTAGNDTTGISKIELDSDSVATTAALCVKILGLVKKVDNAFNTAGADTDNAKFEVLINRALSTDTAQIGT